MDISVPVFSDHINDFLDPLAGNCQIVPMNRDALTIIDFDKAVGLLTEGKICAFPTDTVFGLGARADSSKAIRTIFATKERPNTRPLIALCSDLEMAASLVEFCPVALQLAKLWPGALTLVMPSLPGNKISPEVSLGMKNLGVRIPASDQVRSLIRAVGYPLATTSANKSGQKTSLSVSDVQHQFGNEVPILKTGETSSDKESTILQVNAGSVILLRQGGLPVVQIEQMSGISINR